MLPLAAVLLDPYADILRKNVGDLRLFYLININLWRCCFISNVNKSSKAVICVLVPICHNIGYIILKNYPTHF